MSRAPSSLLLVEDSDSLAAVYQAYLAKEPVSMLRVSTGNEAMQQLKQRPPEVMLLDLKLPDMSGMEVLQWLVNEGIPTAVIIITAHGSIDFAVDAMRLGVVDFLEKPFDAQRLKVTVNNALKIYQLQGMVEDYQVEAKRRTFHGFVGGSLPMQRVYRMIEAVAPSKASVFITGESGTGKEVCAEAIHAEGPRADKPFIALNCGAIPKDLMESEIFGHVKGAFTGAATDRKGAASLADGGTLFLDEIGEMSMALQTKLLRFVQTGRFQKVGSGKEEQVDVRFLCATNRDPWAEVQAGRFREDLYYRLYVVPIHLPPLRERGNDILAIANRFLAAFALEEGKGFRRFSSVAAAMLKSHSWPGNVRELQNVVRNICVLHDGQEVKAQQLPPPLNSQATYEEQDSDPSEAVSAEEALNKAAFDADASPAPLQPLWLTEKQAIERAIAACAGNIPKAAELLEVSPSTLYRKKQSWEEQGL